MALDGCRHVALMSVSLVCTSRPGLLLNTSARERCTMLRWHAIVQEDGVYLKLALGHLLMAHYQTRVGILPACNYGLHRHETGGSALQRRVTGSQGRQWPMLGTVSREPIWPVLGPATWMPS